MKLVDTEPRLDNQAVRQLLSRMKELVAIVLLVAGVSRPGLGQTETEATLAAPTPVATSGDATNAPIKPDIQQLIQEPSFTNSTGMLMIKISSTLWAGKYEVTQDEYKKITGGNPSRYQGGANPVDSVSWNDAITFCRSLTAQEKTQEMLPEGFAYTLATQSQWESLVAGTPLAQAVTSEKNSRAGTAMVGSLGENGAGLCDLRGNVWEFCLDPLDKPYRVLRGAGWNSFYEPNLRLEFRWYANGPDDRKEYYGFRCVLVPKQ